MAIPFADVTDDDLRDADLVHVLDPADKKYHAYLPCRPRADPGPGQAVVSAATFEVAIDRAKAAEQVEELRRRIAKVHGLTT
jgi:hypothetical protein